MKRLYLFRHAKTAPADSGDGDHARVLTERGRADAVLMANYIGKKDYRPDTTLCSDSARTRETLAIIRSLIDLRSRVDYRAELYLATRAKLLLVIQRLPPRVESVMLVGHNPGLEELAAELLDPIEENTRRDRDMLEEKFPTAALAVFDFDIEEWKRLRVRSGRLIDFATPKDLKA